MDDQFDTLRSNRAIARGFTLTEMLVAVAVLAVVILATSTIFGTSQRVASLGEANAELIQQASAIERRIRRDIERMSGEGFLAIQCVGVQNNINVGSTGRLLDPQRFSNDEIRCDQLVFMTNGREPSTRFVAGYQASGLGDKPAPAEGSAARVYLGHGVQMPIQPPRATVENAQLYDHNRANTSIYPWTFNSAYPVLPDGPGSSVPIITPPAHDWVLVRQPVLLADDDLVGVIAGNTGGYNSLTQSDQYMGVHSNGPNSAPSLFVEDGGALYFDPEISNGRVDVCASELDDIRREVCIPWNDLGGPANSSDDQVSPLVRVDDVLEAMFEGYPRGEPTAPSMKNLDQMLVNNVLAANVSDFQIDWMWADGVGRELDAQFNSFPGGLPGVVIDSNTQPWWGLGSPAQNSNNVGQPVYSALDGFGGNIIERTPNAPNGVRRYGAVFGYNRDYGYMRSGDDNPIVDGNGEPIFADPYGYAFSGNGNSGTNYYVQTYTPWPTALRITMRLHDSNNVIEGGRVFQFVVPLPSNE